MEPTYRQKNMAKAREARLSKLREQRLEDMARELREAGWIVYEPGNNECVTCGLHFESNQ